MGLVKAPSGVMVLCELANSSLRGPGFLESSVAGVTLQLGYRDSSLSLWGRDFFCCLNLGLTPSPNSCGWLARDGSIIILDNLGEAEF